MNKEIRLGIIGLGNCASSLVQGIEFYKNNDTTVGLITPDIAGYKVTDIKPVVGFDVDARKIGKDISEAIFQKPNCTRKIADVPDLGANVYMGPVSDGVSPHMVEYSDKDRTFVVADLDPVDISAKLKENKVDVVVNYLPVGSEEATKIYAQAAIDAGCAFVNCIPQFIASNPEWDKRFREAGLPVLGDDVKSQLGATYSHRVFIQAMLDRGLPVDHTDQYNQGGNTDFLNMTAEHRLKHKLESKKDSIETLLPDGQKLGKNAYFGPGEGNAQSGKQGHGYLPEQNDNKTAIINALGRIWGDTPVEYQIRMSVEDSPNSAGVVADAIRLAKLAKDRGLAGTINPASAFYFKHPLHQITDSEAKNQVLDFIRNGHR